MKKLILLIMLIPSLLFAGPLQEMHKRVIAGQTGGGGGYSTEILRPDADTTTEAWQLSTGTDSYDLLNDESDTTYLYAQDANDYAYTLVSIADTSASSGKVINKITVYARAQCYSGTCTNDMAVRLRETIGGSYETAVYFTPTATTGDFSRELTNNPFTETTWTSAEIDDLHITFYTASISAGEEIRGFEVWIEVEYTP